MSLLVISVWPSVEDLYAVVKTHDKKKFCNCLIEVANELTVSV